MIATARTTWTTVTPAILITTFAEIAAALMLLDSVAKDAFRAPQGLLFLVGCVVNPFLDGLLRCARAAAISHDTIALGDLAAELVKPTHRFLVPIVLSSRLEFVAATAESRPRSVPATIETAIEFDQPCLFDSVFALSHETQTFSKIFFLIRERLPSEVLQHLQALLFHSRFDLFLEAKSLFEVGNDVGKLLAGEHETCFVEDIEFWSLDDA